MTAAARKRAVRREERPAAAGYAAVHLGGEIYCRRLAPAAITLFVAQGMHVKECIILGPEEVAKLRRWLDEGAA